MHERLPQNEKDEAGGFVLSFYFGDGESAGLSYFPCGCPPEG
jgi:hypothetical protein